MKRITKRDRILRHLVENGTITTWEAIKEYGETRLSAKIFELRKDYIITDEWQHSINRYGDPVKFKIYKLVSIKEKKYE